MAETENTIIMFVLIVVIIAAGRRELSRACTIQHQRNSVCQLINIFVWEDNTTQRSL